MGSGLRVSVHCVFSLMLPFPAATPASRKYHEDLEPEGMVVVPGELSHPQVGRGRPGTWALARRACWVPVSTELPQGLLGAVLRTGRGRPGPSVWPRALGASIPTSLSLPPVAKGSADSWRFPRVFRGYAERKRRKRENDSASVIQR